MDILRTKLFGIVVVFAMALPGMSYAVAPANTLIKSEASLIYDELEQAILVSSTIKVGLKPAAPTLSSPSNVTVAENQRSSTQYDITSNANGSDGYILEVQVSFDGVNTTVSNPASIKDNHSVSINSLSLGATGSLEPVAAGVAQIKVPSDSEGAADNIVNNIEVGDTVVIANIAYQIAGVIEGDEFATLTLAEGLASGIRAGVLIAERKTFTVEVENVGVVVPSFDSSGGGTPHLEIDVLAKSSTAPGESTTDSLIIEVVEIGFDKYVRNVNNPNGPGLPQYEHDGYDFYKGDVSGVQDDVIEYLIVIVANSELNGSQVTNQIPEHTQYVTGSTSMNGTTALDVSGQSPLVAGMTVNAAGSQAGKIPKGEEVHVKFRVKIE